MAFKTASTNVSISAAVVSTFGRDAETLEFVVVDRGGDDPVVVPELRLQLRVVEAVDMQQAEGAGVARLVRREELDPRRRGAEAIGQRSRR